MILVALLDDEIKEYGEALSDVTVDFNLDFELMIMPIVVNVNHFKYWLSAYPFYKNVQKEGVMLYAS